MRTKFFANTKIIGMGKFTDIQNRNLVIINFNLIDLNPIHSKQKKIAVDQ